MKHHVSVPKTGQTTCYNTSGAIIDCAGTGQDGEFQKGMALPQPRFIDVGDGTITDNLTGLIWLKNANCPNAIRDWETGLNDVVSLNSDGTMDGNNCGDTSNAGSHQTDWRFPNIRELHSLVNLEYSVPAMSNAEGSGQSIGGAPFVNLKETTYWSSTTFALVPDQAFVVDFGYGSVIAHDKTDLRWIIGVLSVSVRSDVIGARVRANRHGGGTEAAGDRSLSGVMGVILRL